MIRLLVASVALLSATSGLLSARTPGAGASAVLPSEGPLSAGPLHGPQSSQDLGTEADLSGANPSTSAARSTQVPTTQPSSPQGSSTQGSSANKTGAQVQGTSATTVQGAGTSASTMPVGTGAPIYYLPHQILPDGDGDLIPDRLERVLLLDPAQSDSDGDGYDDFRAVLAFGESPATAPWGNRMRVTAHSENHQGMPVLWVDTFIHLVSRNIQPTLASFEASLALPGGIQLPLSSYLAHSPFEVVLREDPDQGISCRVSFRLESEALLSVLQHFTLIVEADLLGQQERAGVYLESTPGGLATYLPIGSGDLTMQPSDPESTDDPFWTRGRFCKLRLSTIAQSPVGTFVEVVAADCVQSSQEAVCPLTCGQNLGRVLFFPDLLRLITGS